MESNEKKSKALSIASYILHGIIVVLFIMGAVTNLLQTEMAVDGAVKMGYPESSVFYLGIVLLISTVLYAIPKTTFIGAILLTAWLGGAVASHIINGDPMFNTLFPVIFGIFVWLSVWLRNDKMRKLISF